MCSHISSNHYGFFATFELKAQVVERVVEAKKSSEKKKARTSSGPKATTKKVKKVRDPNMPKRPAAAFFLFMDDFRKMFKEQNPDNKNVSVVAKEGGEKWNSMTDEVADDAQGRGILDELEADGVDSSYLVFFTLEYRSCRCRTLLDDCFFTRSCAPVTMKAIRELLAAQLGTGNAEGRKI